MMGPKPIPPEQLIDDVRAVAESLGHPPLTTEYKRHGSHALQTILRRLDAESWDDALRVAGLDPDDAIDRWQDTRQYTYSDDDLLGALIEWRHARGEWPTPSEFNDAPKYPSATPYYDRFEGFYPAVDQAKARHDGGDE